MVSAWTVARIRDMVLAADEALETRIITARHHAAVIGKARALLAQHGWTWADLGIQDEP